MTRTIEDFLLGLQNENSEVRRKTAISLAFWDDSRSVELLRTALADPETRVRTAAARSLGYRGANRGETGMFAPLAVALSDKAGEVRAAAAIWIGRLQDIRAFESLMSLITDEDLDVRAAAAQSLGSLGDARAAAPLLELLHGQNEPMPHRQSLYAVVRNAANQALVQLGDPEPETRLSVALASNDPDLRLAAALDLANRPDPRALAPLMEVLTQSWSGMVSSWKARISAIEGLSKLRDRGAVPTLLLALGDDDFDVKAAANEALVELGDPEPFERLSRVIRFPHTDVKAAMNRAYDRLESEQFAKTWVDKDRDMRRTAIADLGKLADPRAVPPLLNALDSSDKELGQTANQSLIDLGDPQPFERLSMLISYEDTDLSGKAFKQLVELGGARATEIVMNALNHEDSRVQLKAARALRELSATPVFDAWMILLTHGNTYEQKAAARALGNLQDKRAISELFEALRDYEVGVRSAANEALIQLGDPEPQRRLAILAERGWTDAEETLEDWRASGELQSLEAIKMFADLGDREAVPILERVMESTPSDDIGYAAVTALGRLGDPSAIHTLMKAIVDEAFWSGIREAAEKAIVDIVSKDFEDGLSSLVEELQYGKYVQIAAAVLLGELGNESVVEALKELCEEEDSPVREAAQKALQRLKSRRML